MSNFRQHPALHVDPARYAIRIRDALITAIYERFPVIILIEVVLSTALIYGILYGVVTPAGMIAWQCAHFLVIAVHVFAYLRFRKRGNYSMEHLDRLLNIGMALLGVLWALILAFSLVKMPDYALQLYYYLLAQVFGLLALFAINERQLAFYAFAVPQSVSLAVAGLIMGNEHNYIAVVTLLCTTALVLLGRAKRRNLSQSLALRFALADTAEELSEQRDVAERANIAKSKFLAAASHDLRQPLHALTLLSAALENKVADTETREIVASIRGSVGSLEKLFDALLDISRLDAGVMQPRLQHFELGVLLHRVCSEHTIEAENKGLDLRLEPCSFIAHSDPLLFERVLRNYLTNAIRYTENGGIHLRCVRSAGQLRVEVMDTGIGVPQPQRLAIFDEFFQLSNPERDREKGLGLGLAIVRRIAELLGHDYGVESAAGGGACFYIAVPEGDEALLVREQPAQAPMSSLVGLRVVVIDDDPAIRESTQKLLAVWGCDSLVVENENDAARLARERFDSIDAIVADYRLREHRTGLHAIQRLRDEFGAQIPALLVSGDTSPERLREVAESGYTLVHKPVQLPVLKVFLASAQRAKAATNPVC